MVTITKQRKGKEKSSLIVFGIPFEVSHLDYEPNSKLKVPQNDLLVFFRQWL